ncbi:alpha/beta fold hydrolase [Nocardia albiluteola]|nr:alpha/beta fold hydrolase [Nocardia albiluteola]
MHAMLPARMTGLLDLVGALRRARRAGLRARNYADARFDPPRVAPVVVPVITSDGATLRVHSYGPENGDVIVFAHGWTCCIEYWNPQINALAGRYRVIAYDQRGHGESELGNVPLSTDLLADDLSAVLDAVLRPGQRAVLVGHSLGGMTIQAWAARTRVPVSERAAAVVLTNTAAGDLIAETTVIPPLRRLPLPLRLPIGRAILGAPGPFPPIAPVRWGFRRGVMTLASTGDVADFAFNIVRACPGTVRARFGVLLAALELGRAAAGLTVPTTVIAGENDDLTPVVHAERIAAMLTGAGVLDRFVVLPTGHLGNVEAVEAFNAELSRVLATAFTAQRATA